MNEKKATKKADSKKALIEGPIMKNLILFSLPILLGSIVTQIYNLADSVVVGQFVGKDALAAVAASTPVMTIINMFLIGLSSGSNVVVAQRFGSGNKEALQKAVGTVSILTLGCAASVTIIGLIICNPLLRLMGTPDNIFADSRSYLFIVFIGTMGNMVYNMGSGALRGMGDSTWPFIFLCICSGLNIVLDLLFVIAFHWNVVGVAAATAIAQIISGIGIIYRLNKGDYGVSLKFRDMKIDAYEVKQIIGIGLPAAIQNVGNSVAGIFVQTFANMFGSTFIAANSIVNKVDNMANIPVMSLSTALGTFVGQNIGLYRMERIKKGINGSMITLIGLGSVMCVLLICFRNTLPLIFNTDPEVISIAAKGVMVMAFVCIFHGIDRCLVNAMRGAGKSVVPMLTAQFGTFSRVPLTYFLAARTGNFMGFFYAMAIASLMRTLAIAVYYFFGGWKKAVKKFMEKREELERAEKEKAAEA